MSGDRPPRAYVVTSVKERPDGHFDVAATFTEGPLERFHVLVRREALLILDRVVAAHAATLKSPPTGPR